MLRIILILIFIPVLLSCQSEGSDTDHDALCDCVQTDVKGRWDMNLSPECIQLCVETFGPELTGMEGWFRENCGYELKHPEVSPKDPEVVETRN